MFGFVVHTVKVLCVREKDEGVTALLLKKMKVKVQGKHVEIRSVLGDGRMCC